MSYFQSVSFLSCEFYKVWRPWMYLDSKHSPHFHPENNLIRFTGDGEILQVYEAKLPWLDQQIMSRRDFTFNVTLLVTSSAPRATPQSRAMPSVPNVPLYQNLTYYIPWNRAYWMSFHTAFANPHDAHLVSDMNQNKLRHRAFNIRLKVMRKRSPN